MEVGRVPFGKLVRQEVTFRDVNANLDDDDSLLELVWNIPSWFHEDASSTEQQTTTPHLEEKQFGSLRLNTTYVPTIRIVSEGCCFFLYYLPRNRSPTFK